MDRSGSRAQRPDRRSPELFLIFSPATIPAPPNLVIDDTFVHDGSISAGNSDGYIDPGDYFGGRRSAQYRRACRFGDRGEDFDRYPGVTLIQSASSYPDLPPGRSSTNRTVFAYR